MTSERSNGGRFHRSGVLLVLVGLGGFLADYAFNVGLSRLLDPHGYGDFRVAWAFASFCGVVVLLGGDRATAHVLAGPLERGETGKVREYLRFYLSVGAGLSAVVIAATWLGSYLHVGTSDPLHHHAASWAVLAVPVAAAGALVSRVLQTGGRLLLAAVPWRLGVPLLNLGFVAALLATGIPVGVHHAILVASFVVSAVTAWQWWKLRRRELRRPDRDPGFRAPRRWLRSSVPMMGVFLVSLALDQSDLYFLELLGQESEVGLYAAAGRTAHFLLLVQTTFVGVVAPGLQLAIEKGRREGRLYVTDARRGLLAWVGGAAVLLLLAARPLLSLFGPTFPAAAPELRLLVGGNLVWAAAALAVLWLQYTGRGLAVVTITAATLAVDSAANAVLIPTWGMTGAAASTAITMTLAAAALLVAARSRD